MRAMGTIGFHPLWHTGDTPIRPREAGEQRERVAVVLGAEVAVVRCTIAVEPWPNSLATTNRSTPRCTSQLAKVWRKLCGLTFGMSARSHAAARSHRTLLQPPSTRPTRWASWPRQARVERG